MGGAQRRGPRDRGERNARSAVALAAALAAAWLAGAIVAPAPDAGEHPGGGISARSAYAAVCHQIPGRSLTVAGVPMAVCARCAGLYAGGVLGLACGAAWTAWRRRAPRAVLFLAVAPTLVQWLSVRSGAPDPGELVRMLVSLPAGAACGWFLAHGLGDLVAGWPARRFPETRPST